MKNISKILLTAILVFGLALYFDVEAANTKSSCQNGVCANTGDDLPEEATKITPDISVNLNFSVYKQAEPSQPPICNEGTQLFYAVRHGIGGSITNWNYVKAGPGQGIQYTFNSGPDQQKNYYQGIFYCWSFQGTSKLNVDSVINKLRVFNQVWFTPEFNMTTGVTLPVTGGNDKPDVTIHGETTSWEFPNPLAAKDLTELMGVIMGWLQIIVLPVAVIVIIISGIMMLAAGTKPEWFVKGKKMLLWAVIGLAITLIGEGFLKLIESIINLKNR